MSDNAPFLPKDRHYHPTSHLWVKPDSAACGRIGMDEMELENLGELAYVSLHEVGTVVKAGESIGSIEAAKMTAEIFSPVTGKISRVNDAVLQNPRLVNDNPYSDGWLLEIEMSRWPEDAQSLVAGDQIDSWALAEQKRFQDSMPANG